MRARTHLNRIQRALYDRLKGSARNTLGALTPELRRYLLDYQREFLGFRPGFREVSTKRELLSALQRSHVAMCGDYHTLAQAQKTVIRLLRDALPGLRRRERPVVLALEMARPGDDGKIARFLEGKCTEREFLRAIDFRRQWGFPWDNYRPLFEFARDEKIRVVGMNAPRRERAPTLAERDRYAARVLADLTAEDPRQLVVALIGDLHLARRHLPRQLERELRKRNLAEGEGARRRVIIHQNHDQVYWKLADRGLEQLVDVVKVRDDVFCVMNTPPWVKLKSHLRWTEISVESDAATVLVGDSNREAALSGGELDEVLQDVDFAEEIREQLAVIRKFIGLEAEPDDDFRIATPADVTFVDRMALSTAEERVLGRCLAELESHFVPRENVIFLTSLNLNHSAAQAAAFLHAKTSGFRRLFLAPKRDFYTFVWVEALAFLGSKIINHKRKCSGPQDLERMADDKSRAGRESARIARAALRHLDREERWEKDGVRRFVGLPFPEGPLAPERTLFHYKVAKTLGHLLGNAIYLSVIEGTVERGRVRKLFENAFRGGEAKRLYLDWIGHLDEHRYRKVKAKSQL